MQTSTLPECKHVCYVIPPHMSSKHRAYQLQQQDQHVQDTCHRHINHCQTFRKERQDFQRQQRTIQAERLDLAFVVKKPNYSVFNANHSSSLPGKIYDVNDYQKDKDAFNAITSAQKTVQYFTTLGRNSIDNKGMDLKSTVHFDQKYNNAFWNSKQMVYGDGDQVVFNSFTINIDVIGHEITHGVMEYMANLKYANQPGALNEHVSDFFGKCVQHWDQVEMAKSTGITPVFDGIIGSGLLAKYEGVTYPGLRSMANPGTAYVNHPILGTDPQPGRFGAYVSLPNTEDGDNGGVHINSGIPNHAAWLFYEKFKAKANGNIVLYEIPARIWYDTLKHINYKCKFPEFAKQTIASAKNVEQYIKEKGEDYFKVQTCLRNAWQEVQVNT